VGSSRDGGDGVVVGEPKGLVRARHQAEIATRRATHALLKPNPLHPGDVLEQPEQRCRRRNEATAGLLLGEGVEGLLNGVAVLLDEGIELDAFLVEQHLERALEASSHRAGRAATVARGSSRLAP